MEPSEVTSERDPSLPNEPCVASTATPPRSLGKNKSCHILNSDSRNMIFHCYTYTSKFVADMLGVSIRTVFRIPTVEKITTKFSERMELQSLRQCTVRRLLAEIGFKHEKRSHNSLVIDRNDITDWRDRYLHDVECYRVEGRKIYLDETWVTAGHTRSTSNGLTTGLKQPFGKGQRLIVTHIGSEDGFVDSCLGVFRGQKTGDYHEEMDGYRFEGWFSDVLQKDFKLSMVNAILREKIKQVTAEDWRNSIQHMMDLEAKFRLDTSGSKHIQPIIIQLDDDDTDESDSDCELSGIEPLDEA
ncbi:hypothetical protein HPB50_027780 [Hyalomma asiaticum]|nr:hypothetical protein HPB50_027780 [Hyalomma asiaticum]